MKNLYCIALLATILSTAYAISIIDTQAHLRAKSLNDSSDIPDDFPEFKEHYSENRFNHFDPLETRTYKQRYFMSDKYWDVESGPIFVYICGEYTCSVPTDRMFPYALVQEHKGLYFVVEHRFYGKSQLLEDWSVENLKLLTVELGLADLAYFIETKQKEILEKFPKNNSGKKRKVITIGGSYPGAMSAWFRYKYPHVTDGSLSSSGVISPIYNFWQYDWQVNKSMKLTPRCLELAGSWVQTIYEHVTSGDQEKIDYIFKMFSAGKDYTPEDFMQFISGSFWGKVQYGGRTEMCDQFLSFKDETLENQLKGFAKFTGEAGDNSLGDITSTKIDFNSSMRQWTWQYCTQFGYLFTASKDSKLTSDLTSLDYQLKMCERVFGVKLDPKNYMEELNEVLLGGIEMRGSNIFFTNGIEDGWQWAGMRSITSENTSMTSHIVDCPNCAHCVDLYTESPKDARDLVNTRHEIRKHVAAWLKGEGFPEDSQNVVNQQAKILRKLQLVVE